MVAQLKALTGFEGQLKELAQNRQKRSEEDYLLGMRALFQAKESGFHDKASLRKACDHLMAALQKNRNHPKPYISMGYLLMITGDRKRATRYLQAALRLEPGNQIATDFLDSLQEASRVQLEVKDTLKRFDSLQAGAAQDPDALYESLERVIKTTFQQLMRSPHHTLPTVNPEAQAGQKAKLDEIQALYQGIETQLKLLESDIDTSQLYFQLRPLETLMRRYQQAQDISLAFMQLLTDIELGKKQARKLINDFQQRHQDLDQDFENLLDDCDRIADQLDGLDEKKVDIQVVKKPYKELIALAQVLQELLDENA